MLLCNGFVQPRQNIGNWGRSSGSPANSKPRGEVSVDHREISSQDRADLIHTCACNGDLGTSGLHFQGLHGKQKTMSKPVVSWRMTRGSHESFWRRPIYMMKKLIKVLKKTGTLVILTSAKGSHRFSALICDINDIILSVVPSVILVTWSGSNMSHFISVACRPSLWCSILLSNTSTTTLFAWGPSLFISFDEIVPIGRLGGSESCVSIFFLWLGHHVH